ncbi:MAG: TrmB family transcriptional regulator, partial [Nanoarchaeota archaeon]|nr:TrmB family transcriptional regulator [Nanoarchaeota archaeon]
MCGIIHTMIESLKKLGLNKTESNIYLQLIKKGSLTAIEISKETKIHRRTIYDNLNILINKG